MLRFSAFPALIWAMFRALESWTAHLSAGEFGGITVSDIDGDGQFELLVANASGPNRILKYSNGQLREIVSPVIAAVGLATFGVAAADVDGDGREELLLLSDPCRVLRRGLDGHWVLWSERGRIASGFTVSDRRGSGRYGISLSLGGETELIEAAPDAALRSLTTSPVSGMRVKVDANGTLAEFVASNDAPHELMIGKRDVATPSLAFPSDLRAVLAADFDNDGFEELLLANHGEQNRVYRLAEDLNLLEAGDAAKSGLSAAVADLDGDGVLELIMSHDGSIGVYKSRTATGNAWLRIRPMTRFNAPARGAAVSCRMNGRTLVRRVDAGCNGLSLSEPAAHFGLGRDPRVESATITWPDGATLTLPEPDVNCTYSVPYPRG
jgi:hypothetical protein